METDKNKRRLKIYIIEQNAMIEILRIATLSNTLRASEYLMIPILKEIPKDAELLVVDYDMSRLGFRCIFRHKSFEEVPLGTEIPIELINPRKNIKYKKTNYSWIF